MPTFGLRSMNSSKSLLLTKGGGQEENMTSLDKAPSHLLSAWSEWCHKLWHLHDHSELLL